MTSSNLDPPARLNESQARRLLVTCRYADKLIGEIEEILNSAASKAAFPRYIQNIAPVQRKTIEDYLARIRAQLVRVLDGQDIPRPDATIPASRAVYVSLGSIDIAVEELRPGYMRGYGELPPPVALELEGIAGELRGLLARLSQYLLQGADQDLRQRLARLEQTSAEFDLLKKIERVVGERGLIEFRTSIAAIVERLEDRSLEIAVFGRVSSGKSSLLNAILGEEILPVGVTPITAVPTRIRYGSTPLLRVSFAERPAQSLGLDRLKDVASEQQNPGNEKRVTRIVVELPSRRLREGVTFVDTPGLGALATSGAAETLAYLPKCDLGVVLIDAGSILTPDDLQTIWTLQEAGIPVHALLSKADLLSSADAERMVAYVKKNVAEECRLNPPVYAVSAIPSHREMLSLWFDSEILPLYERSQELKSLSVKRKIGALRESVVAALTMRLRRSRGLSGTDPENLREIEARLRRATGRIMEKRIGLESEIRILSGETVWMLERAADRLSEEKIQDREQSSQRDLLVFATILQHVHQRVKVCRQQIESLAGELQSDLSRAAKALGMSDLPSEQEFTNVIRAMPVFDFAVVDLGLSRSRWPYRLGRAVARMWVKRALRSRLEESLSKALSIYCGVFQAWSSSVVQQIERRFATYADGYRAQAERSLASPNLGTEEENALLSDLQSLGGASSEIEFNAPPVSADR
jgi:GTP-binding protein EngB required for normal cell division